MFSKIFSLKKKNDKPKEGLPEAILYLPQKNKIKKEQLQAYCLKNNLKVMHSFEEKNGNLEKPALERFNLVALLEFLQYDTFKYVVIENINDISRNKDEQLWIKDKIYHSGKILNVVNAYYIDKVELSEETAYSEYENRFQKAKEVLESRINNAFLKKYPDQYSLVIGMRKCFLSCNTCIDVMLPSKGLAEAEMSLESFKKYVDYVPDDIVNFPIILCPLGETLTFKNLVPMVQYITDTKPNAISIFATNGLLLTEEMATDLIDASLSNIMISVNAPDREEYKWYTGYDGYEKLEKNIVNFVRIRNEKNLDKPFIRVQVLGIKRFESKFEMFIKKWEQIVDAVEVTPVAFCNNIPELENIDKFKKDIDSPVVMTCSALFRHCMIYPDGKIVPCTDPTPPMTSEYPVVLGNANNVNPFEIWKSLPYMKLREKNLNGLPIMDACLTCDRIVSGDWTINETFEQDLIRKSKLKKLLHC